MREPIVDPFGGFSEWTAQALFGCWRALPSNKVRRHIGRWPNSSAHRILVNSQSVQFHRQKNNPRKGDARDPLPLSPALRLIVR